MAGEIMNFNIIQTELIMQELKTEILLLKLKKKIIMAVNILQPDLKQKDFMNLHMEGLKQE